MVRANKDVEEKGELNVQSNSGFSSLVTCSQSFQILRQLDVYKRVVNDTYSDYDPSVDPYLYTPQSQKRITFLRRINGGFKRIFHECENRVSKTFLSCCLWDKKGQRCNWGLKSFTPFLFLPPSSDFYFKEYELVV